MKILWLSHLVPYPPKGGVLQRSYYLLKEVARHHDVHLLAFNQKDLMKLFYDTQSSGLKDTQKQLESFCDSVEFANIPCDTNPTQKKMLALRSIFTKEPYTINWLESKEFTLLLKKYLAEFDFDFVHFDTISLAPYLKYCQEIPTSLDHHNIESHMLFRRSTKESNFLKKLYFWQEAKRLEKYEQLNCPNFTFHITCSDIDKERLNSLSPDSAVHTIPNGVDIDYFDPEPISIKEDKLLFVGTLSWYPNIEAVLFITNEIWPLLKKQMPHVQVDIIGANPPQEIVDLAKSDPNLHIHGFVDDIRPFFKKSKCYVCPIKDGGGTKLKIIDALSMGMAIIADEIACEGIDLRNNKDVIFADTAESYVEKIVQVLTNDDQRKSLEDKARDRAKESYSYTSIGEDLSNLYNKYLLN